jgi:hypothetical protein
MPRIDTDFQGQLPFHHGDTEDPENMEPRMNAATDFVIPAKLVLDMIEEQESIFWEL